MKEEIQKLKAEIAELNSKIAKLENATPKERFWKPNERESFIYFIGSFQLFTKDNNCNRKDYIEFANCYKLDEKELAEKDLAKLKARQVIQRTADELIGERYWYRDGKDNYLIGDRQLEVYYAEFKGSDIYFPTIELAEKCRELCRDEYKILLGVNE